MEDRGVAGGKCRGRERHGGETGGRGDWRYSRGGGAWEWERDGGQARGASLLCP